MITVKEIHSKKEMKQFVTFPFSLYKDNPYWVPPIINDEVASFDAKKNPVFEHATARFFLAYQNNKIVGRIAAITNTYEIEVQKVKKMRFGWFDVVDNAEVTKALLHKVIQIGKQNELEFVEGPVGFSNLDKAGVLVEGFDYLGTMATWYNYPYYATHFEKLGFVPEKEYTENIIPFKNIDIKKYRRLKELIQKRYSLKLVELQTTKDVLPYVDEMFSLFSETYSKLSSFVPISEKQIDFFKKKYIPFINPEYIKFVVDKHNKLVAFSIVMPSFSKALQKANGKLFPFGFLHLLKAKKHSKDIISYLIGVQPQFQNKGITAIIYDDYHRIFEEKGIENFINTPMLVSNSKIHNIWQQFNPITHKRRRTYKLDL